MSTRNPSNLESYTAVNFWWRYPLWKARIFMTEIAADRSKVEIAHVLRIGPIALAIIWQEPRPQEKPR